MLENISSDAIRAFMRCIKHALERTSTGFTHRANPMLLPGPPGIENQVGGSEFFKVKKVLKVIRKSHVTT